MAIVPGVSASECFSLSLISNLRPAGPALKLSNILISSGRILGSMVALKRRKNAAMSLLNSIWARLLHVNVELNREYQYLYLLHSYASARTNRERHKCLFSSINVLVVEPALGEEVIWIMECSFRAMNGIVLCSHNSLV